MKENEESRMTPYLLHAIFFCQDSCNSPFIVPPVSTLVSLPICSLHFNRMIFPQHSGLLFTEKKKKIELSYVAYIIEILLPLWFHLCLVLSVHSLHSSHPGSYPYYCHNSSYRRVFVYEFLLPQCVLLSSSLS